MTYSSVTGLAAAPGEATKQELQQIANFFATPAGTAPMRREFGMPQDALIGNNANLIAARLTEAVGEGLRRFVPGFEARNIRVSVDKAGKVEFAADIARV